MKPHVLLGAALLTFAPHTGISPEASKAGFMQSRSGAPEPDVRSCPGSWLLCDPGAGT